MGVLMTGTVMVVLGTIIIGGFKALPKVKQKQITEYIVNLDK